MIEPDGIFFRQVLGRQRRPEALALCPEYFLRTSVSTRRRNLPGLLRFDSRPALPCFSPFALRSRYRRHTRFVCR